MFYHPRSDDDRPQPAARREYTFEDQLSQLVNYCRAVYWNVVGAREPARVADEGLKAGDTR
jgi:hypothetical protein